MLNKLLLTAAMVAAIGIPSVMAQDSDTSFGVAPDGAPLWLRDVRISPDGDFIAFTYKGDIWSVPVSGGEARQLTVRDTYEASPVWSPDGKKIAFLSDRNGNFDVYVMDAKGGTPKRLTSNSAAEVPEGFSPDGKEVYYSAAIQAPASSVMYPSGRMTQLYAVDIETGKSRQVLATPANMISISPDGKKMLYQDVKGFEDEWRKHHTSSVTRDIWLYTPEDGKHRNLTARAGEDRNPVLDPANGIVYFLSERDGGTFNVYSFPIDNPSQAVRLTDFKTHPVRFLSRANNGTLAFAYDGEIYTMAGRSAAPRKVDITLATDNTERPKRLSVKPSGGIVSPDGKMVAFLNRGDVFVTSVEYPTTVQVTRTPQAERHLSWGSDNRSLYYTSERSGRKNIFRARIARKEDPDFPNAVEFIEEAIFPEYSGNGAVTEYSHPSVSPDGKKMAYVKNRNQLWIRDLSSGTDRQITNGETYPGKDDGMYVEWSPDSRWLTMEIIPKMRDPYGDIGLVEVETGKITNLTNTGYMETNPRFVLDGNAIIYFTEQYGLRAQASWGSQDDIMIVFLNREARDRFMLSEEDYALLKEQEKKASKKSDADDDKAKDKKGKKDKKNGNDDKKDDTKDIVVEFEGIEDRVMRLTPFSSMLSDAIVTADGETLYFLCEVEDGFDLWKLPLRKREPKLAAKMGSSGASLQADKSGKQLFVIGREMKKIDKGDKLTAIKVSATHDIDLAKEREAMFDYVAVEEGERFYDTGMHGIDWPAMTAAYRKFLPHINNNYDFAEMLSELLGELNVSHTGGRFRGASDTPSTDRTASLGLLYDMNFKGDGLKVDEVLANGPFDKAASKIGKGAVITAVNGHAIDAGTDFGELFNNIVGKKTLVAFTSPSGEKVSEVVVPCSSSKISDLMYRRWIKQRAADVDRWSDGRLGYVHIESMNDESFRPMYADLLGKYNNREGIVIDIRWNGGGRMHEDIEQLFTGQKYLTQVIRGKDVCDMPSRRWNKPSVMLVAEPCYSNAHGTPWVYQHQKIGKVVGMPVPGTMTSVNWVTLQDPTLVFGIPVIGYRTAEENYLENTQLEPDVKIANTPEQIVAGEDAQLHEAVNVLLRQLDAAK